MYHFFFMSSYFHMAFECPSDLRALSFVWITTTKYYTIRQCGLRTYFINLGKSTVLMMLILTDTRKWLPPMSRSQFTLLHDGFKTYLLPSAPERNSIKALGQKEKMSYQHTTVFDSFSICICLSINFKSERQ